MRCTLMKLALFLLFFFFVYSKREKDRTRNVAREFIPNAPWDRIKSRDIQRQRNKVQTFWYRICKFVLTTYLKIFLFLTTISLENISRIRKDIVFLQLYLFLAVHVYRGIKHNWTCIITVQDAAAINSSVEIHWFVW